MSAGEGPAGGAADGLCATAAAPSADPSAARSARYIDDVAPLVDAIPPGRVLTYGDVAELTGWGAARAVGAAMSRHGLELPWWRVVRADGSLVAGLLARARLHWAEEGTATVADDHGDVTGVDLERARWDGDGSG